MREEEEESTHSEEEEEEQTTEDNDSSEDELLELQDQVADVPFELLQKAKAEGHAKAPRQKSKQELKRLNKNRPMEISSKKPVRRFREVIQAPKKMSRDPRFESLCGDFDESRFRRSYSFLYDESLPAERQELYKSLKKEKDPDVIAEKKKKLSWMERQIQSEMDRRKQAEKAAGQKRKERELVKQCKKPYYMKNSEKRKVALVEKYQELKASGKLEAYMAKRRRKNAAKDHRYVPYRRIRDEA